MWDRAGSAPGLYRQCLSLVAEQVALPSQSPSPGEYQIQQFQLDPEQADNMGPEMQCSTACAQVSGAPTSCRGLPCSGSARAGTRSSFSVALHRFRVHLGGLLLVSLFAYSTFVALVRKASVSYALHRTCPTRAHTPRNRSIQCLSGTLRRWHSLQLMWTQHDLCCCRCTCTSELGATCDVYNVYTLAVLSRTRCQEAFSWWFTSTTSCLCNPIITC